MTWPSGHFEASVEWWRLGEEGRKPILDAIGLLGLSPAEVRAITFGPKAAQVSIIHRHDGHAHMDGHCDKPVILHDEDGVMVCSCGRKVGEGHRLCLIEEEVVYPT